MWLRSHLKWWIAVRRSRDFKGAIPHFCVLRETGSSVTLVEYVPDQDMGASGDYLVLFDGMYRVRQFRVVAEGQGKTLFSAMKSCRSSRRGKKAAP